MRYVALTYDVVPDFITRRRACRDAQLALVREVQGHGVLMLAGALGGPPDGALLVFRAESENSAAASSWTTARSMSSP